MTNGPTESLNNLIKRIKRAAFGFRNFANYRIRALLYAGKPNWNLLATLTPHYVPLIDVPLILRGRHRPGYEYPTGHVFLSIGVAAPADRHPVGFEAA